MSDIDAKIVFRNKQFDEKGYKYQWTGLKLWSEPVLRDDLLSFGISSKINRGEKTTTLRAMPTTVNLQDLPLHIPSILPTSTSKRYLQLETEATSRDASSPFDLLNFDIKLSNEVMHISRETLGLPMAVQMLLTSSVALYLCIYAVIVPLSFVINGFRTQFVV